VHSAPLEWESPLDVKGPKVPLLGKAEKAQLEVLILEKLTAHYERHGAASLLAENVRIVVHGNGVSLDHGEMPDPLAAIPVKALFTALCYLDSASPVIPAEALGPLAAEATTAAATQINRIAAP
jgi:hypothetical protein